MPQSQWILLLVAAAVAVAVLLRLYMVLGRRGGTEPQGAAPSWARGKALTPPQSTLSAPGVPGLFDIQLADKRFDAAKFLDGARTAYRLIVTGFEKGDRDVLKPLLSAEVYGGFAAAITARAGAPNPYRLADIREARILSGSVQGGMMEITVSFIAAYDAAGSIGAPQEVTDVWSFARPVGAADPNWTLMATSGETR
jgi:predicted lipid-binding transport protein (Tim44 family)